MSIDFSPQERAALHGRAQRMSDAIKSIKHAITEGSMGAGDHTADFPLDEGRVILALNELRASADASWLVLAARGGRHMNARPFDSTSWSTLMWAGRHKEGYDG